MIINKRSHKLRLTIIHMVIIFLCLSTLLPFLLVVSISISNEKNIVEYGYSLLPMDIDFTSYKYVFTNPGQLIQSYKISTFYSLFGTFVSVLMMAMAAYALSRSSFRYRTLITFYVFFTMLFSGGLVPTYILIVKYLNLSNTIWVLIIPGLVNAFHIIILRTFFQKLPESVFESAELDGASEYTIFFRLVIPMSKPVIATIALFGVLGRWNDWFSALLYITDESLYPLQYLLQRILMNLQFLVENMDKLPPDIKESVSQIPSESVRMAMAVVAAGPMVCIFPFFQKYFVKGLTIGSVKG